ncbi:MAG: peptidoglycan DD-metalloendopeptidase family protein, partial [Fusobacteriaceae bacterium]
ILILIFSYSVEQLEIFNKEIVSLDKFVDYYPVDDSEEDGEQILSGNFFTLTREYGVDSEEGEEPKEVVVEEPNLEAETKLKPVTFKEHRIQKGETISIIAKKYGIKEEVLRYNNKNIGKIIQIGEKIKIPSENVIEYKVKSGDSVFRIAQRFNVKREVLREYNDVKDSTLKVDQTLYIKDPTIKIVVAKPVLPRPKTNEKKSTVRENVKVVKTLNFKMPIKYSGITSAYGTRFHPVLKRYIHHAGIDMRARYIDVKAPKEGKVKFSGYMNGYGRIIIITHDGGYETRYAHLNKAYVKKGDIVSSGEKIAQSGNSGRSTGPHLHFEIRKNGQTVDPMRYLK